MSAVVILSWDPAARVLEFVAVNGGAGGEPETTPVGADEAADITASLAGLTLPRMAELEAAEGIVLIGDVSPAEVARCTVTAVGRRDERRFRLRDEERRSVLACLPVAVMGAADAAQAPAADELEYLYTGQPDSPGCWLNCAGGIGPWLAARHPAEDGKKRAAEREKLRKRDENRRARANERFVNPYTFVPFPRAIERDVPGGHHRLGPGRLSGAFTVTWTFTTPLQAPEGASGTTVLRLPGTSVKGAVRAVHETMAGGCLRVFDADFIPSYRDHAQVRGSEWKLALVNKATDDGQPLSVTLCDEVVWVGIAQLRRACGRSLATGSRVTIHDADVLAAKHVLGRKELPTSAEVTRDGDWVVLVTDSGTRREKVPDKKTGGTRDGAYLLACGRVGKLDAEVTEAAWRTFKIAAAGARDMQPGARRRDGRDQDNGQPDARRPTARVKLGTREIGDRRVVTGRLWPGDVVWARTGTQGAAATIDELSLAALWRHPGWGRDQHADRAPQDWSAGRRVPPGLLGCRDPRDLCPTCRVFGSVDQQVREAGEHARQRAYAGHVRFGDACSEQPVGLTKFDRAPLGMPRPGAGQFYLDYGPAGNSAAQEGGKPTREWGAAPDDGQRRQMRGRKFYWHADPEKQSVPRHIAREHQRRRTDGSASELVSQRWLAPAGTVLRQRVTFDNLSRGELGGLLAAFEPHRVLPPGPRPGSLMMHLGGGKPLGLGSCTAAVSELNVSTAASRYGGAPTEAPDADAYRNEFAGDCPAEIVDDVWPSLTAVLCGGTVNAAQVWYPPGRYWSDQQAYPELFDRPFAFFTASSGIHLKQGDERRLIGLPGPADGDQSVRIVPNEDPR